MPEYSSSSDWSQSPSKPSVRRSRDFEYIPPTGIDTDEADVVDLAQAEPTGNEVVEAAPGDVKPTGLFKVAAGVAARATSMGGVRKAMGHGVRQVGHFGGAVRHSLHGVPEVDPWRCLIATLSIWGVAVVIARMVVA